MWFDVPMSWNGKQNAVALGSSPRASRAGSIATIQMSVPTGRPSCDDAGGGDGRRP